MKGFEAGLLGVLLAALVACSPGGGSSSIFTPDNVYGPRPPGGAKEISPDELEKRVKSGELTLISAKAAQQKRKAAQDQLSKDRAFLEALPSKSEALKSLLGPKAGVQATPDGDYLLESTGNDGKPFRVLTLGEAVMFRSMVENYQQARNPANGLSVYTMALAPLDPNLRDKLPSPDSLKGKSLSEVQKALSDLDKLLQTVPNLDAVAPTTSAAQNLRRQDLSITEGGPGAGNGMDNNAAADGRCGTPSANGLYSRVNWPLKYFIAPVKNQASRGTCWDFTAVGAIESRERVVNDRAINLSEQYLNNVHKRDAFLGIDFGGEGAFASNVLDKFVDRDLPIASESAWTYNPGSGRRGNALEGVCEGYTGLCSESNHQSPTSCARVRSDVFCGFETVNYSGGSSVRASRSRSVWENTALGGDMPVAVMRGLLAGGQTLWAGFDVHPGFDNPNQGTPNLGFVTDFTDRSRGGHEALIVGFVPDGGLLGLPVVPGGTGGGWFILKNSWGCGVGDAGFYYIPVRYMQRFFAYVRTLEMPPARSAAWNDTLQALRPPSLSLSLVSGGRNVDLNRPFTVQATLSGGGAGCCGITWLPAPAFSDSRTATYRFSAEGEHTIRATVRTSRGLEVMRDIVVNVVNTPPNMGIVGPLPSAADPILRPSTSSNFRASARDPNEPGGVLRDDQIAWAITRPDGSVENRTGYSFAYTWGQLGSYRFRIVGMDSQGVTGTAERSYTVSNDANPYTTIDVSILTPHTYQQIRPDVPTELRIGPPIPPDPKKAGPLSYRWTASYTLNGQQRAVEIGKFEKFTWTPAQTPDFVNLSAPLEVQVSVEVSDTQNGTQGRDSVPVVLDKNAP